MFGLLHRRRGRIPLFGFTRDFLAVGDKAFSLYYIGTHNNEHTLAFWKYKRHTREELEEFCLSQHSVFWMTHKLCHGFGKMYYKLSIYHCSDPYIARYSYFRIEFDDYCDFLSLAFAQHRRLTARRMSREKKICWKKFGF